MNDLISRQEAIDEIEKLQTYKLFEDDEMILVDRNDVVNELLKAHSEQQWIPCSERLPEPNRHDELNVDVYYLAQTEFGDMIVASYNESHEGTTWWEQMYSCRIFDDKIVAWMPLPEPYTGRRGEDE